MGAQYRDVDINMEDSGNSCGSSVVSDFSSPDHADFFDGDGDDVQVSDLEGEVDRKESPNNLKPKEDYKIPEVSLGKYILDALSTGDSDKIIYVDAETDETLTCRQLIMQITKCCSVYKKLGIKKDDVITLVSENSIFYSVPIIAAVLMGIVVNFVNPDSSKRELSRTLQMCKPKIVISSETALKTLSEIEYNSLLINNWLPNIITISCLKSLMDEQLSVSINSFYAQFDCSTQDAVIMLSSGTTKSSKGVVLTHKNILASLSYGTHNHYFNFSTFDEVVLIYLPCFHIYGLLLMLYAISIPTTTVIMKKFKPELFLRTIEKHKITLMGIVPSTLLFMIETPYLEKYNTSTLRNIILGAAPIQLSLHEKAKQKFPNAVISPYYGLTETTGPCTVSSKLFNKIGSVGVLVPNMQGRVWNVESNRPVGVYEQGELCFKGPQIFKTYVGNEVTYKECIDSDGFYHTGDWGYFDEDGFCFIENRMKDIIKYKGIQVSPSEIESVILSHPEVKDCAVVGAPHERAGQVAWAFVVRKNNSCKEQTIIDFVAENMSKEQQLHGGVSFTDEIPRNAPGKVMKHKLLEIFEKK